MSRRPVRLLLDEHIWEGLAGVLTERGYDVVHLNHTGRRGIDDEAVLEMATSQGRAVLTFNIRDFAPLGAAWAETDRRHAGVILSSELPPSELLKRTDRLLKTLAAEDVSNTVRWLSDFRTE